MINHCARLKVYLLSLIVKRCNCSSVRLMLLNVNTYANSVIESSLALMKFMEVHIGRMVSTVDVRE